MADDVHSEQSGLPIARAEGGRVEVPPPTLVAMTDDQFERYLKAQGPVRVPTTRSVLDEAARLANEKRVRVVIEITPWLTMEEE